MIRSRYLCCRDLQASLRIRAGSVRTGERALPSRGPISKPMKGVAGVGPDVVVVEEELDKLSRMTSWMATK